MSELRNHADVEALRQKAKMTFAWDFLFCGGGDSIKERLQKLYEIVSTNCLRRNESAKTALVIANTGIAGAIETSHGSGECKLKYEDLDGIAYVGEFLRSCGGNGYHTSFHLYRDNSLNAEVVVANGDDVSVVKLFNCPLCE